MTDDTTEMVTVMNGRDTLGFLVASRGGAWRALDAEGQPREFPSRELARQEIVRHAFGGKVGS